MPAGLPDVMAALRGMASLGLSPADVLGRLRDSRPAFDAMANTAYWRFADPVAAQDARLRWVQFTDALDAADGTSVEHVLGAYSTAAASFNRALPAVEGLAGIFLDTSLLLGAPETVSGLVRARTALIGEMPVGPMSVVKPVWWAGALGLSAPVSGVGNLLTAGAPDRALVEGVASFAREFPEWDFLVVGTVWTGSEFRARAVDAGRLASVVDAYARVIGRVPVVVLRGVPDEELLGRLRLVDVPVAVLQEVQAGGLNTAWRLSDERGEVLLAEVSRLDAGRVAQVVRSLEGRRGAAAVLDVDVAEGLVTGDAGRRKRLFEQAPARFRTESVRSVVKARADVLPDDRGAQLLRMAVEFDDADQGMFAYEYMVAEARPGMLLDALVKLARGPGTMGGLTTRHLVRLAAADAVHPAAGQVGMGDPESLFMRDFLAGVGALLAGGSVDVTTFLDDNRDRLRDNLPLKDRLVTVLNDVAVARLNDEAGTQSGLVPNLQALQAAVLQC